MRARLGCLGAGDEREEREGVEGGGAGLVVSEGRLEEGLHAREAVDGEGDEEDGLLAVSPDTLERRAGRPAPAALTAMSALTESWPAKTPTKPAWRIRMFFSAPAAEALAAPTACLTPSRVASCSSETWALTGIVTRTR